MSISKSLSGSEIIKALNGKANIIGYSEIKNTHSLKELLGPHKAVVILYEQKENYGHWTCLFEQSPNTIEFFDPYGLVINEQIKFASRTQQDKLGTRHPVLLYLLIKSPYKHIEFNSYPFQEFKQGVNTCGRHVLCRLWFRDLPLNKYVELFKNTNGFNADTMVTLLSKKV